VDGVVLHQTPARVVAGRGERNVPLMIGTNEDEGTLFTMLLPTDLTDEEIIAGLPETVIDTGAIAEAYAARTNDRRLILDLMTDAIFLVPTLRLADVQAATPTPVWVYLFTWKTPVFGGLLGATHALELPFLWDMIDNPQWQAFVGEEAPRALATAIQDAWLAFARTGDPATAAVAWPRYNATTRPTMVFGDEIGVVDDPSQRMREVWYQSTLAP
jgi:para-nitrobenzyl esterase